MASKLLLALALLLSLSASLALRTPFLSEEQQCRFQKLNAAQPSQRIESEGGTTELWDETQEQFQCAGIAAGRITIRRNGLSLPNYQPTPRLVFIERGKGYISVVFPGCAETYHSRMIQSQRTPESKEKWEEQQEGGNVRDLHQKVHRIRRGDIIAIPAGAVHWCYNDGEEELVAVSVNDIKHQSNQLDDRNRAFYLAGGVPSGGRGGQGGRQEEEQNFQNIFRGFDVNLLSESFNVPEELIRRLQGEKEERGLIITARERIQFIRPEESRQGEEQEWESSHRHNTEENGFEETFCSLKFITPLENRREADIYSKDAGKLNVVDRHKLPILEFIDMSAEKSHLFPNSLVSPDWAMAGHTIVYITRGDAQIQIVDQSGQSLMNDRVNQGDLFVVPQFYTSTAKAGNEGVEWVSFKTTGWPFRNPLAGYTSIMKGLPLQVVSNIYQVSPRQAMDLVELKDYLDLMCKRTKNESRGHRAKYEVSLLSHFSTVKEF